jgi:death-on-curing protein
MPKGAAPPSLSQLVDRLDVLLAKPLDFRKTDPESTKRKVELLSAVAAYFNTLSVTDFGGRIGAERQPGLLEQAVGAAFQTFEDTDPYPEPFDKAAMLLRGITKGHPFQDGNKRTGFLTATYFLAQMGYELRKPVPEEEIIALATRVSAGKLVEVADITSEMRPFYLDS